MAIYNVELLKEWTHPNGNVYPAGTRFRCTYDLRQELIEGGYIEGAVKKPQAKRTTSKKSK